MPPAEMAERLAGLERPSRPGLRWTGPDQWHVTLRFFASVDPSDLVEALTSVRMASPVRARCGSEAFALSRHVWALPVAGLDDLAASVARATAQLGGADGRKFRGHLTLARSPKRGGLAGLPSVELSYEWVVDEIVAVRSELGRLGARHTVIYRHGL